MTVSDAQKKLLQQTASVMRDRGLDVTKGMYKKLFKEHPEYLNFFNQTNQETEKQPSAMAETIYQFVQHLDNLDAMTPQMSRLSNKHRAVTVKPEYYPTLGKYLVQSIKEQLGDKGTPEVVAAWQALYDLMAQTFIKREKELYANLGGDEAEKGFVPFNVAKKESVGGSTYVFTLNRQDGKKPWAYNAGQYVTIRVEKNGINQQGHYIPVETDGNSYTIVCREGHVDQNTIVSEELIRNRQVGGTVLVSAPSGSFGLAGDAKNSLFIGGGIGITSLVGLVNELNKQGKASSVSVVQCATTQDRAVYSDKLKGLLKDNYTLLTKESPISKQNLQGKLKSDTDVYVSGAETFLETVKGILDGLGHPKDKVHVKSIEPTLGLLKEIAKK